MTKFTNGVQGKPKVAVRTVFVKCITTNGGGYNSGQLKQPTDFDNVAFLAHSTDYEQKDLFAAWNNDNPESKVFYLGMKGDEFDNL